MMWIAGLEEVPRMKKCVRAPDSASGVMVGGRGRRKGRWRPK